MWNHLRISLRRPAFLMVQALSVIIVLLVFWFLWFFMLNQNPWVETIIQPNDPRNILYLFLQEMGFFSENAIWLIYAVIALIVAHQIAKALFSVPIGGESEPADVDTLFAAPMNGHVFFTAKYFRTIPRRLLIYFYITIALLPVIWFFMRDYTYALTIDMVLLLLLLVFILGEIGAVATNTLYFARKFVSQPRRYKRYCRLVFFLGVGIGSFLLVSPILIVGSVVIPGPLYNLARLFVAIVFSGHLTVVSPHVPVFIHLYFPALPWVIAGLLIGFVILLELSQFLSDKVSIDMYEDIAAAIRRRGLSLGWLSRFSVVFRRVKNPLVAVFQKDFVTGLRKPGKTFYIIGITANFIFALYLVVFPPTLDSVVQLPLNLMLLVGELYIILLIMVVPVLSINASDPFQGERGMIYLIRLSQVRPFRFTLIKYLQQLMTPFLLAIPVAIYFSLFLGNQLLFLVAMAVLPHAILISTAIGVALGSRYPHTPGIKQETPVALIITFPVISWAAMFPILLIFLGLVPTDILLIMPSSLLATPYTITLVLFLLGWSSHSYLRQE